MDTKTLAGTTILAALVIVFDYALKFSGLKIPFPLLPYLKFDFTGVPIVLSLLLFGLPSAVITSGVAFLAIMGRSGDLLGSSMKALAEFSTIFGVALGFRLFKNYGRIGRLSSLILGILSRCTFMLVANIVILPQTAAIVTGSLLTAFNAIQGALSILVGYSLYGIISRKIPSTLKSPATKAETNQSN